MPDSREPGSEETRLRSHLLDKDETRPVAWKCFGLAVRWKWTSHQSPESARSRVMLFDAAWLPAERQCMFCSLPSEFAARATLQSALLGPPPLHPDSNSGDPARGRGQVLKMGQAIGVGIWS